MPGTVTGAVDAPLDVFGGLVTNMAPSDLPMGASPDCQDVVFAPGKVFSRPGLQSEFPTIAGNPTVNYLKTYVTSNELLRTLIQDSVNSLWREDASASPGVLTNLTTAALGYSISQQLLPNLYGKSTTLFGREYLAFSDGKLGVDLPRQYDDTNLDRVSQCGPGTAPSVADESLSFVVAAAGVPGAQMTPTFAIAGGGATESGNIVTIKLTATSVTGPKIGDNVVIAGVGVGGYNGTFPILSINNSAPGGVTFTYFNTTSGLAASGGGTVDFQIAIITTTTPNNFGVGQLVTTAGIAVGGYNVGPVAIRSVTSSTVFSIFLGVTSLANSGGGTAVPNGSVVAGVHQVTLMFLTKQGYLTAPAPPTTWTAGGSKRAVVSFGYNLVPQNVVAFVVAFTLAGGANFYYLNGGVSTIFSSNMVVPISNPNIPPTTATIDFTDSALGSGTNVDNQFNLVYLGETAGVASYNSRLVTWGSLAKVSNLLNTQLYGGALSPFIVPSGWALDPVFGGGGTVVVGNGPVVGSTNWLITGDGATATVGMITQQAFKDFRNVPILQPNTAYNVSFRLNQQTSQLFTQGVLNIEFFSAGAPLAGSFTLQLNTLAFTSGNNWLRFTGSVLSPLTSIPSDITLRVYANGTPSPNRSSVQISEIEIYPANQAFQQSTLLVSVASQAETFDGVNSVMQVMPYNGQAVRNAFKLRGFLYLVKERSMYQTKDDSTNEPALWPIEQVSEKVGTPSLNGVAYGEDWVVIAARDGAYIFWGQEPEKISQEIQPLWDTINWSAGQTIWTEVDIKRKRILIGVPTGAAISPNLVLMMDYSTLQTAQEIAAEASIHSSVYTGKNFDIDKSRKWTKWNIVANSGAFIERNDGTAQTWVGNGAGTGKVYQIGAAPAEGGTQTTDDGTAINAYYDTFLFLEHMLEQQFQLGSHRKLFIYLVLFVQGGGNLLLTYFPDALTAPQPLPTIPLRSPAVRDSELAINAVGSRVSFRIQTNNAVGTVGDWFVLEKFVPTIKRHDYADVRGSST